MFHYSYIILLHYCCFGWCLIRNFLIPCHYSSCCSSRCCCFSSSSSSFSCCCCSSSCLFQKEQGSVVLNRIGMKFKRIVLGLRGKYASTAWRSGISDMAPCFQECSYDAISRGKVLPAGECTQSVRWAPAACSNFRLPVNNYAYSSYSYLLSGGHFVLFFSQFFRVRPIVTVFFEFSGQYQCKWLSKKHRLVSQIRAKSPVKPRSHWRLQSPKLAVTIIASVDEALYVARDVKLYSVLTHLLLSCTKSEKNVLNWSLTSTPTFFCWKPSRKPGFDWE